MAAAVIATLFINGTPEYAILILGAITASTLSYSIRVARLYSLALIVMGAYSHTGYSLIALLATVPATMALVADVRHKQQVKLVQEKRLLKPNPTRNRPQQ